MTTEISPELTDAVLWIGLALGILAMFAFLAVMAEAKAKQERKQKRSGL